MDCVGDPINVYLILYKNILSGNRCGYPQKGGHSWIASFFISELERN